MQADRRQSGLVKRRACRGFTYLGVLLAVLFVGAGLAALGTVWSLQAQRAKEAELLRVGRAYQVAIARYVAATPRGVHEYPRALDDLAEDRRGQKVERHLRTLYPDPVTGLPNWDVVRLADGAVIGVASTSTKIPLKRAGFPPWANSFEDRACLCDWQFVYLPQLLDAAAVSPQTAVR